MFEVKSPNHSCSFNLKSIFLAGSIEQGKAIDWQREVVDNLDDLFGIIYNPRRDEWDSSWKQSIDNPGFYEQVNWEITYIEDSDIVIFNFAPDCKSPITLMELGLVCGMNKENVYVCCSDDFWRRGNIEIMCDRFGIKLFNELSVMMSHVREQL